MVHSRCSVTEEHKAASDLKQLVGGSRFSECGLKAASIGIPKRGFESAVLDSA